LRLYYLDTSAVVKLYIREAGTDRLLGLASRAADHQLAILALTKVEFHSAIRKRQRLGDIDDLRATELTDRFEQNLESRFVRQIITDAVLDIATALVNRHSLRAYDALQLAGCSVLRLNPGGQEPVFVCADITLLQAAAHEGLQTMDPCH
jgi:predicted nucleic acid-binding protein